MKKAKLIFLGKTGRETLVATFANVNEAAQCRDLLQAKCADQDHSYYAIEYKNGHGDTVRQHADSFAKQVLYMAKSVQQNIKLYLS
jgi:hypothetical protein